MKIKWILTQIFYKIQLIFMYAYAFLALNATIQGYFGEAPDFLFEYSSLIEYLMRYKADIFQHSERSIFAFLVVIDILTKTTNPLGLSRLVKFNMVLILVLEMFMILTIYLWDLISTRDISNLDINSDFDLLDSFSFYDNLFYSCLWVVYSLLYLYCFFCAMRKKKPRFPGSANKIIKSIIFLFAKQDRYEQLLYKESMQLK